jgi:hypothetical protein
LPAVDPRAHANERREVQTVDVVGRDGVLARPHGRSVCELDLVAWLEHLAQLEAGAVVGAQGVDLDR